MSEPFLIGLEIGRMAAQRQAEYEIGWVVEQRIAMESGRATQSRKRKRSWGGFAPAAVGVAATAIVALWLSATVFKAPIPQKVEAAPGPSEVLDVNRSTVSPTAPN